MFLIKKIKNKRRGFLFIIFRFLFLTSLSLLSFVALSQCLSGREKQRSRSENTQKKKRREEKRKEKKKKKATYKRGVKKREQNRRS